MINHYGYDIFIIMYLFSICNDNAIATVLRHPVYSVAYLRYALYVLSDIKNLLLILLKWHSCCIFAFRKTMI